MDVTFSSLVFVTILYCLVFIPSHIAGISGSPSNKSILPNKSSVFDKICPRGSFLETLKHDVFFSSIPVILLNSRLLEGVKAEHALRDVEGSKCREDMTFVLREVESGISGRNSISKSLVQAVDSWGKIPAGVFRGNHHAIGDFHQCLELKGIDGRNETRNFKGKYCLTMFPHLEESLTDFMFPSPGPQNGHPTLWHAMSQLYRYALLGVCFPDSCTQEDILRVVKSFAEPTPAMILGCTEAGEEKEGVYSGLLVWILLLVCPCAVAMATTTELLLKKSSGKNSSSLLVKTFSLVCNLEDLTKPESPNGAFSFTHGIKALLHGAVVFNHAHLLQGYVGVHKTYGGIPDIPGTSLHDIRLGVDTFFIIGGMLTGHSASILLQRRGKFDLMKILVRNTLKRVLRFAPTMFVMIAITAYILPLISHGPFSYVIKYEGESCRKYWWNNMFFIQNLVFHEDEKRKCLTTSWFLAADLQFSSVSLPVVYFFWRRRKFGILLFSLLTIASCAITFSRLSRIEPESLKASLISSNEFTEYYRMVYFSPWTRVVPYLVGSMYGVARLYCSGKRGGTRDNSVRFTCFGWACSCLCLGFILMNSPYQYLASNRGNLSFLYYSIHRLLWAASIGWVLFGISMSNAGVLKRILVFKPFVIISRISLPLFLVSWLIQTYMHSSSLHAMPTSKLYMVSCSIAHFVLSVIAAVFIWLFYEAPIAKLLNEIVLHKVALKAKCS